MISIYEDLDFLEFLLEQYKNDKFPEAKENLKLFKYMTLSFLVTGVVMFLLFWGDSMGISSISVFWTLSFVWSLFWLYYSKKVAQINLNDLTKMKETLVRLGVQFDKSQIAEETEKYLTDIKITYIKTLKGCLSEMKMDISSWPVEDNKILKRRCRELKPESTDDQRKVSCGEMVQIVNNAIKKTNTNLNIKIPYKIKQTKEIEDRHNQHREHNFCSCEIDVLGFPLLIEF